MERQNTMSDVIVNKIHHAVKVGKKQVLPTEFYRQRRIKHCSWNARYCAWNITQIFIFSSSNSSLKENKYHQTLFVAGNATFKSLCRSVCPSLLF